MEKSKEAVDAANIRAAYAEVMANQIAGSGDTSKTVTTKQGTAGWANTFDFPENLTVEAGKESTLVPAAGGTVTIKATSTGATIDCKKD